MALNVTYDNSAAGFGNTSPTITQSFTVGNNTNRVLLVGVSSNRVNPVSGVTYAGTSMTKIDEDSNGLNIGDLQTYILLNPATGANNLVLSQPGGNNVRFTIHSYYNARQSSQPDNHTIGDNNGGGPGNYSLSMSPNQANSLFWGCVHSGVSGTDNTTGILNNKVGSVSNPLLFGGDAGLVNSSTSMGNVDATAFVVIGLMTIAGAPSALTATITDTSSTSDSETTMIGRFSSILETISLSDTISSFFGRFATILDSISLSDSISEFLMWIRQSKNSSSFTNGTKDSSSWTDLNKDNSSFTNQNKS